LEIRSRLFWQLASPTFTPAAECRLFAKPGIFVHQRFIGQFVSRLTTRGVRKMISLTLFRSILCGGFPNGLIGLLDQRIELGDLDCVVPLLVLAKQKQIRFVLRTIAVKEQLVLFGDQLT
jgi:hypothetical protein